MWMLNWKAGKLGKLKLMTICLMQVFDNSTDSCTTNFSISGQPQSCTEAIATSQDLFHFVFDQVEYAKCVQ